MTSILVQPPDPGRFPRVYIALAVVLFAALLAAPIGVSSPLVRISADGRDLKVTHGTTVGDLTKRGKLGGRDGDLMAAFSGRVLTQGGGMPGSVTRNGRLASSEQQVFDGDVFASTNGRNVVESVTATETAMPVPTEMTGRGPLVVLASPGAPGLQKTYVGELSGETTTAVLVEPTPMVIKRYGHAGTKKLVALTFDDGPWPGQTEKILNVLRENKVKATFFMLGSLARKHPTLARRVAREGHLVGNHTMNHAYLAKMKASAIDQQIVRGERAIFNATKVEPVWFRPPGGSISPAVWSSARRADLKVALWTVDPQDWRRPGIGNLVKRTVAASKPGSVILLHDGGGNRDQTVKGLKYIISQLRAKGYEFVTLDQLKAR